MTSTHLHTNEIFLHDTHLFVYPTGAVWLDPVFVLVFMAGLTAK